MKCQNVLIPPYGPLLHKKKCCEFQLFSLLISLYSIPKITRNSLANFFERPHLFSILYLCEDSRVDVQEPERGHIWPLVDLLEVGPHIQNEDLVERRRVGTHHTFGERDKENRSCSIGRKRKIQRQDKNRKAAQISNRQAGVIIIKNKQ